MSLFVFFNDTATTEIYTLSLHDALPIFSGGETTGTTVTPEAPGAPGAPGGPAGSGGVRVGNGGASDGAGDRKSTRLNSSHANISYAVFCLKKKKIRQRRGLDIPGLTTLD